MLHRILVFCLLLSCLPAFAQSKRPFTFEDMMNLKRVGDFTVSPDGHWLTFSAVDVSLENNTKTSHIWIVPVSGSAPERQLTNDPSGEDRLRFSPDGKRVLFTSARGGASQVWMQDFDAASGTLTGEARKVTEISTEADGAIWSPDGKQILFVSAVYPDCKDDACNKARDEEKSKSKVKAQVFERLMYRHWNAYGNGKRSHLFLADVSCNASAAGTACSAKDLTPGDHDVPPFSLGGQDQYQFSPDGREVVFTSNLDEVEATSTNSDVFVLSLADPQAKARNLTAENHGSDGTPMYSPDGKWIAIRSQFRGGYESDRFRLRLIDRATGKITSITEGFDRWVDAMSWAPDSKSLFITAGNEGDAPIYRVDVAAFLAAKTNTFVPVTKVVGGFNDTPVLLNDGKTLVFARNSVRFPTELFKLELSANEKEPATIQLTHANDALLSQIQMQPVEPFWFTGAEKHKVQGFLVKPPNFDAKKKYPVKFLIHGGPQGAWGDDWSFRWNPNLFAADGYVAVMINFHGSTGYGQPFIDAINGNWGGAPFEDLMIGLDYAEKTFPFIDKDRECALGASYGGYMANWLLGHTTRFKCIVSHDGMFNPESAYGTTEELWFNEWEFKGTPWNNNALYRKWSPMLAAKSFKTPTLVVHGQLDYRLDVSEGMQLFTTLQRQGIPSKMLYFPDEGHWVLKPQNSQLWYKTVNGWCDQWTKK